MHRVKLHSHGARWRAMQGNANNASSGIMTCTSNAYRHTELDQVKLNEGQGKQENGSIKWHMRIGRWSRKQIPTQYQYVPRHMKNHIYGRCSSQYTRTPKPQILEIHLAKTSSTKEHSTSYKKPQQEESRHIFWRCCSSQWMHLKS